MAKYEPIHIGNQTVDVIKAIQLLQENIAKAFAGIPDPVPFQAAVVSKDYKATGYEGVIHVDASAGPVRISLPKPSTLLPPLTVKQVNASGTFGKVTVVASDGSKTIGGLASIALDDTGTGNVQLTSNGIQHWPVTAYGGNPPTTPAPTPILPPIPPLPPAPIPPVPPPIPTAGQVASSFAWGSQLGDSSGVETWVAGGTLDFTNMGTGLVSVEFGADVLSAIGDATFNLRIGGSDHAADGTIVCTLTTSANAFTLARDSEQITNPGGLQRAKITVTSSGSTHLAQIKSINVRASQP